MKKILLPFLLGLGLISAASAQYSFPNTPPPYDNKVYPWDYDGQSLNWNTSEYVPLIMNRLPMRLLYPLGFDSAKVATQKFPLTIMFHGIGESGEKSDKDNNFQLKYGAREHITARNNGTHNAFVLFYQSYGSTLNTGDETTLIKFIDLAIATLGVDPNRVTVHGLSGGGMSIWQITSKYPKYFAAAAPMSAATGAQAQPSFIEPLKYKAYWQSQGGLDKAPTPVNGNNVANAFNSLGANHTYSFYPDLGHGTWNRMYSEKDFFPFLNRASLLRIHPLFFKSNFCEGEAITGKLGIQGGFAAYEWQRNGVTIAGATTNEYTFNNLGSYRVRFKRTSTGPWTVWSEPLEVKRVNASPTPVIQANGPTALPTLDGRTSVRLEVKSSANYGNYAWSDGSAKSYVDVNQAGVYSLVATERNGCASAPSNQIRVTYNVNNALPAPGLPQIDILGQTTLLLRWKDNSNTESGFELYSAPTASGPWTLTAQLPANTIQYQHNNLTPNTRYYYSLRAVSNAGGSPYSTANARTKADDLAPQAPTNLQVSGTTATSILLSWNAAIDNSDAPGQLVYEVLNVGTNQIIATTTNAFITLTNNEHGIVHRQLYQLKVRAKDRGNNFSAYTNQVSATPLANGLVYTYYEHDGISQVAEIEALTPLRTGLLETFSTSPRERNDRYAFRFEGSIIIPSTGNYTFFTSSDDGSKLYIDDAEVVDNDGIHGNREASGTVENLTAGAHKIRVLYFQGSGGANLNVRWSGPGISKQEIPAAALRENFTPVAPPNAPSGLTVAAVDYKSARLNWSDNSSNETGFEIFRALSNSGPFAVVGTAAANARSFTDNSLEGRTTYFYKVRAIGNTGESDFADNIPALTYYYYTGNFSNLNSIVNGTAASVSSGQLTNFSLESRAANSNFAFKFIGKINITTDGTYTFFTESDDGSVLHIDGVQIVANDFNQGMTERSGTIQLTAGAHDIMVAYRQGTGGYGLNVRYQGPGIPKQIIPDIALSKQWPSVTTPQAPAGPATPTNFRAVSNGVSSILLSWNDVANNETNYEIFRDNLQIATIGANTTSYTDGNVVANASYVYKIRAVNAIKGEFSSNVSAVAGNRAPSLASIGNLTARYNFTTTFELRATDPDGDAINFSATGLPAFCSIINNFDGTATLSVNSTSFYDQRVYSNIVVTATDSYGASTSETISLEVNRNYAPIIEPIANQTVLEKEIITITVMAADGNRDNLSISLDGSVPSFVSIAAVQNGRAMITAAPQYNNSGTYPITVKVTDGQGGVSRHTFMLNVAKIARANTVNINFNASFMLQAATPWNNFAKDPNAGSTLVNLKDIDGAATNIEIKFLDTFSRSQNGPNTGENSGVYPDAVLSSFFVNNANTARRIEISGLNPELTYSFDILGSTMDNVAGQTRYTANGISKTLSVHNNRSEIVTLTPLKASADGKIILEISRVANSGGSYINSLVINSMFDDGSVPLLPTNVDANSGSSGEVNLTWDDIAYNETSYSIERKTNGGSFTLLATLPAEANSFIDKTGVGRNTYTYRVRANGNYGNSAWVSTEALTLPNRPPVITDLPLLIGAKEERVTTFEFTIEDREGDNITLSALNLPAFASLTKVSNTKGRITVTNPTYLQRGNHSNIFITVGDGDSDDVRLLTIRVVDNEKISTLVNFNMQDEAAAPWNNLNGRNKRNNFLPNLRNELNQNTGYTLTISEEWQGGEGVDNQNNPTQGAVTGNNSGRYPDKVMKSYFYTTSSANRPIRISGLKSNMRYNVRFFGSSIYQSLNNNTNYNTTGQSKDLAVQSNTQNTVQLNGLQANANGEIIVNVRKANGTFAFINAMEILEYESNAPLLRPDYLRAEGYQDHIKYYVIENNKEVEKVRFEDAVALSWEDNSYQETGFVVERRVLPSGAFGTVATVAANVTTYTDRTVAPATSYEYRVKAISGGQSSSYSIPAKARTLAFTIYVNVNNGNNAGSPWVNLNSAPSARTFSNLRQSNGTSTSIDLRLDVPFEGSNAFGPDAGKNGLYTANVIKTFYFNEIGTISVTKITDLNPDQLYNIRFFASSNFGTKNGVTEYRINDRIAYLDVQWNLTNTVVIPNVRPDASGTITFETEAGPSARYGYLSALVIEAQGNPNTNGARIADNEAVATLAAESGADLSVYPNPTEGLLKVKFTSRYADVAQVRIVDMTGRTVLQQQFSTQEHQNELSIDLSDKIFAPGVYLLRVKTSEFDSKIIRFVKQ